MDETTQRVQEMYSKYPYPSVSPNEGRLNELSTFLQLFGHETKYDFTGKSVLDAGTGTGHRLAAAARAYPQTTFVGADVSDKALGIAASVVSKVNLKNVTLRPYDIMDGAADLGQKFDVVMCMGVLHHLSDPNTGLRNLTRHLKDDGLLFLYLYGLLGGQERMRRKEIIAGLLGGQKSDFETGIQLAKDLQFDNFEFGWNINVDDQQSIDGLIVDAYMNVNERLFDLRSLVDLIASAPPLHGFMIYGLVTGQRGYLFDISVEQGSSSPMAKHLPTQRLIDAYKRLDVVEKCRLFDLFHKPSGYTLLAFPEGGRKRFDPSGRIGRNTILTTG